MNNSFNNVIDFTTYKKTRKIKTFDLSSIQNQSNFIRVVVSPEQLRKLALSLDQEHLKRTQASTEAKQLIPDYDLSIFLKSEDNRSVALVWYPMR